MAVTVKNGYIKMTAAGDSYSAGIVPLAFRWYAINAAGDTCTLNGDSVEIFRAVGLSQYSQVEKLYRQSQERDLSDKRWGATPKTISKFVLASISSGILEIQYRLGG